MSLLGSQTTNESNNTSSVLLPTLLPLNQSITGDPRSPSVYIAQADRLIHTIVVLPPPIIRPLPIGTTFNISFIHPAAAATGAGCVSIACVTTMGTIMPAECSAQKVHRYRIGSTTQEGGNGMTCIVVADVVPPSSILYRMLHTFFVRAGENNEQQGGSSIGNDSDDITLASDQLQDILLILFGINWRTC